MNKRTLLISCAVLAIVLVVGFVVFTNRGGGDDTIEIGAVLLLSGDNALWGENARKGINLLVDEINEGGGINGKKLVVVFEDSRGEPKTAITAFRKLVNANKTPVILGDMLSSTTLAMAPAANETETVLIGISCSAPAVSQAGPYVYRVWPSDIFEGKAFARYINQEGIKTVGIAYQNNDYGTGLKEAFKSQFETKGGKIVAEEAYAPTDRDFRGIAVKMKAAAPDAVYVVGYYEDTARVLKDLKQTGVTARFLGTSSAIHEKLFSIAGSAAEGFTAAVVNDFDLDALTPPQKAFLEKYQARYGEAPDWAATHGGDALKVVVACLRQGKTTGKQIKEYIDSQKTFEGINEGLTFDRGDVVNKPIAVKEARGNKFVTVRKKI